MATSNINPSVVSVSSNTRQQLSTVTVTNGVTALIAGARSQQVQFPVTVSNIGNSITRVANTANAQFSLADPGLVYQLTGQVTLASGTVTDPHTAATVGWFNVSANTAIGSTATINQPVTTTFTNSTGNAVVVALRVTQGGIREAWSYPAAIETAQATLQVISGYQGT